ncbi:hypothetical protein CUJ83_00395 [Methanocella sp. CWC-04]|uniref:Uncharacterized protein n=1 Tax=Methanooceanicella nereidis TaxID=2052831 RepID=A0AAP2W4N4_9EURY|nr:hypothetical protein [Methanocella sp. CWC-04]MCD1293457.1 hypothetical protein [Methanocella sp. CWC-04]
MLTDVILLFEIEGTEEVLGYPMGFTTDMPAVSEDLHITIGDIELEIDDLSYDIPTRKQVIEATITCIDEEDARDVRDEIEVILRDAGIAVFDVELGEIECGCDECSGD